jgi:cell division protein FtsA
MRKEYHEEETEKSVKREESTGDKIKRSFFDRYVDKIKDFLDNAE